MMNFSTTIALNNRLLSFSFSEILRANSSKFYVSVKESHKQVAAFEMKKHSYKDHWIVCEPAPEWILEEEAMFSKWIAKEKITKNRLFY